MTISKDKKYQTRDGREVRIYAVDGRNGSDVHGAVYSADGWTPAAWREDGKYWAYKMEEYDLIEVHTAEDVVTAVCLKDETRENRLGLSSEICQALRDAGKMRDGE
tara:strand:+ start:458 stop:775 length:318 start_codon:yes stop_codon:yes gene_type:complete